MRVSSTGRACRAAASKHANSVRKAICGFANALGGYLIIGADREGNEWTLPGVSFRDKEPSTWLSSVISSGLAPLPPVGEPKVFSRDDGRHAAVVRVGAVPRCITSTGVVYQRVSGQTLPVTDQRVLAELLGAGNAARRRAEPPH